MTATATRTAKKQLCTCITLNCTFLCRHCTTTTWKFLISRFMADVNKRQRFSFVFLNLDTLLSNSTPEKIANIWQIKNVAKKRWSLKQREFTFWVTFSPPLPSLCYSSLLLIKNCLQSAPMFRNCVVLPFCFIFIHLFWLCEKSVFRCTDLSISMKVSLASLPNTLIQCNEWWRIR